MKVCKKDGCENLFSTQFIDNNGKKHNCQKRKFCFECSPYGEHNTRNFNKKLKGYGSGICPYCGGISKGGSSKCYKCYFNEQKIRQIKKVYSIVGYDCWLCGYSKGVKGTSILEFHHINPGNKLFGLSTREFVGKKWEKIFNEMRKCVSLCCRCHREYHAKLILEEDIEEIYKNKWKEIDFNEEKQVIINKIKDSKNKGSKLSLVERSTHNRLVQGSNP